MKVDVKIAGANYTEVPSILLPLTAGGKARFCEVSDTTAEIGDVAQGKKFYTADGELVEGTANVSAGGDTRKKITLVQKDHQKITITCNHPELSMQYDTDRNAVYATEYQNMLDITLKADNDYYVGKITVNGKEQGTVSSNHQYASASMPISDGMIVSATDAVLIPTSPFTTVNLTLQGQGSQFLLGSLLMTLAQSPDSPKIEGIVVVEDADNKGMIFLVKEEQRYAACKAEVTTGTGIKEIIDLTYNIDTDLGATMSGKISDTLYTYLKERSESNAKVTLQIKVAA